MNDFEPGFEPIEVLGERYRSGALSPVAVAEALLERASTG